MSKQILSRAQIITSPISGEPCRPTVHEYIRGKQKITEATYIDPASGTFIRKTVLSVEDVVEPEAK